MSSWGVRTLGTGTDPIIVGIHADDLVEQRVRATLGEPFEPTCDLQGTLDIRVVDPAHLGGDAPRVLRRFRLRDPRVPTVVLLSRQANAEVLRDCYREEVSEVVFTDELEAALATALHRAVERARNAESEEENAAHMATELGARARRLALTLDRLRGAYDETLTALVAALDTRERETACHSQRVAAYAVLLAIREGLEGEPLEELYRGALLHDIGKIGIPDSILLKPGKLDAKEWEVMRSHAQIGASLLGHVSFLSTSVEVPLAHHEAWDGSGYPRGLRGEEIPVSARIFAVVDTYDALRSERPYKAAMEHGACLEVMAGTAGKRLDPSLVRRFSEEPQASWTRLSAGAEADGTFAGALRACEVEES